MKLVHRLGEADLPDDVGSKAKFLSLLAASGFPVPEGWVISASAFDVSQEALPAIVATQLERAMTSSNPDTQHYAVRSSSADEDGETHSLAGQFKSFLFVPREELCRKICDVWRSGFDERVFAYRSQAGLEGPPRPPAVIVQRMVPAETAGVAFTANPATGRRGECVVSAVEGVGSALVSGEVNGDTFHLDHGGHIYGRQPSNGQPLLSDAQIKEIASMALRARDLLKKPQDIEWAYEGGRLYLLQARPITTLRRLPDPDGELNLWDNSNISESYGRITTPLTFPFTPKAYPED